MTRRLVAAAAIAGAAFGVAAPASAAWRCVGGERAGYDLGVCAGSWCPDECFVVAWTYCNAENVQHSICVRFDGEGFPPGR
ncbi:MAG TPA: hypothetical protein VGX28_08695 [Frankiaceae bacterium]|nr:hypothetical protein [Frankiaceae bacterium]